MECRAFNHFDNPATFAPGYVDYMQELVINVYNV